MTDGSGKRYNEGKLRYDLIQPDALKGLVEVLTNGAAKYGDNNWQKGMKWSTVIASLKRHLAAIEAGEDFDPEFMTYHIDNLQCNAHFLSAYYRIYPQGDDRDNTFFDKKVALDIDGVCAQWSDAYCERIGIESRNTNWHFTYKYKRDDSFLEDKEFWMNIKPFEDALNLKYEPIAFITNRTCPISYTEEWLEMNGFECAPVYQCKDSKAKVLKDIGADLFIEDSFRNFADINRSGGTCFLIDRPYNRKFEIGHKRIYSLNDIVNKK